jgi:hypothetical protein
VVELPPDGWVILAQLFAQVISNDFETGTQGFRIKNNPFSAFNMSPSFEPPDAVWIAHNLADGIVQEQRLDGPKEGENQLKTHSVFLFN